MRWLVAVMVSGATAFVPSLVLPQSQRAVAGDWRSTRSKPRKSEWALEQAVASAEEEGNQGAVPSAASKREMLRFYGPALGIFLAAPLMSNIDNAIVGRASGTAALAALSPGTVLSDQILFLFSFLGRATTGIVARANATGGRDSSREALRAPLASAFAIGALVLVPTYVFLTPALLAALRVSPQLTADAAIYARIRGLAAPAALCQSVALSALLALRDASTPLKVVLGAAALNLAGDIALCMWPFSLGCAGAAAATTASVVAGCAWMLASLGRRGLLPTSRGSPWYLDYVPPFTAKRRAALFSSSSSSSVSSATTAGTTAKGRTALSTRKMVAGLGKMVAELAPLVAYAGPLSVIVLTRLAGFAAMSVCVGSFGNVPLVAAYVVCLNTFFLFAFVAEPLSQTAQALVPPLVEAASTAPQAASRSLRRTLRNLALIAGLAGPIIASLCAVGLRLATPLVTSDPAVLDLAVRSIPAVFLVTLQLTLTTTLDGCLVGARDFLWIIVCGTCTCLAQLVALRYVAVAAPKSGLNIGLRTPIALVFSTFTARLLAYFIASGTRVAFGYGPLGRALRPDLYAKRRAANAAKSRQKWAKIKKRNRRLFGGSSTTLGADDAT